MQFCLRNLPYMCTLKQTARIEVRIEVHVYTAARVRICEMHMALRVNVAPVLSTHSSKSSS